MFRPRIMQKYTLLYFLVLYLSIFPSFACGNASLWKDLSEPKIRLGTHYLPYGHIDVLHTLPPQEVFWEHYVKEGIPVIFKRMADYLVSRHTWTDGYLEENYSDLDVMIEETTRMRDIPGRNRTARSINRLGRFLEMYQQHGPMAVVSDLPDPMRHELHVPPFIRYGNRSFLEPTIWFGRDILSTPLHRDPSNTIMCQFYGAKDWTLIHPNYGHRIPQVTELLEGYEDYAFSMINLEDIDVVRFQNFMTVPWTYANVMDGDCIFLPIGYWHQVRSHRGRNLAVSLHF